MSLKVGGTDRYAVLKSDLSKLELKILSDKKHADKASSSREDKNFCVGYIKFSDSRNSAQIGKDFSSIFEGGHVTYGSLGEGEENKFVIVSYSASYLPTLSKAFVDYFSPKQIENNIMPP